MKSVICFLPLLFSTKKQFDDAFYALDNAITAVAKETKGYLGEESWENAEVIRTHGDGSIAHPANQFKEK